MTITNPALLSTAKAALARMEREECAHEDTYRGGFLWEICRCCGKAWADDQGGKPPYCEPVEITELRAAIAKAEGK